MTHLTDAKAHVERIVKLHEKNNQDIQLQVSQTIPKQIREMKASIMKTIGELEKYLLRETKSMGVQKDLRGKSEIARWQSFITTLNDRTNLLSVAQQNGSNVHKYIAAKNTEKTLAGIDNCICQVKKLNLDNLSFSFDKMKFLQNAHVTVNAVNESLAELDGNAQTSCWPPLNSRGRCQGPLATTQVNPNTFARLCTKTTSVGTPVYPYGQRNSRSVA